LPVSGENTTELKPSKGEEQPAVGSPAAKPAKTRGARRIVKRILLILAFVLVFGIGLTVMFYPDISDYVNRKNQSRVVDGYIAAVSREEIDYTPYFEAARRYNERLYHGGGTTIRDTFVSTLAETNRTDEYWGLLRIDNSDVMGYVVVETLDISIPLYHGTSDAVLSAGAGHIQGSSLPVGGENTHTTVSAHTGLPSARFFDKIDTLKSGDIFQIYVLNELFTYQVDQTVVVLPHEVDALKIEPGKDHATLVTCTPYGINSHRLLVRGERIETPPEKRPEALAQKTAQEQAQQTWWDRTQAAIVGALAAVVEFLAELVVGAAQWVMDLLGIEY
jgi:sortase A